MRDRTRSKPDVDLDAIEPFKAQDVQVMETSYVDKTPLDLANTCIFKGDFYDQEKKKVGMVLLPDTFFDLHQAEPNMDVFKKVGLDGYFGLEPWGVDLQRAYELMTTIDKDGVATLTMPEGETMQVQISADLISEALHLPKPDAAYKMPYHLPVQETKQLFLQIPNKKETFNELICKELDLPPYAYTVSILSWGSHRSILSLAKEWPDICTGH